MLTLLFVCVTALIADRLITPIVARRRLARLLRQQQAISESLMPIYAAFGFSVDKNTKAIQENTAAINTAKFQQTTVVEYGKG